MPHAVTIQQTAADADRGRPKPAEIVKSADESGRNARELARKSVSVRITYNNAHGNKRNGGGILQNWRENAGQQPWRHAHYQRRPPPAQHQGGRFAIRKSKRKAPCGATLPPAPMFPSPARQSALLTQVTGKLGGGGVVLKPGRKNETVKRPRSKNKNFGGRKRHICEGEARPLCGGGARAAEWC